LDDLSGALARLASGVATPEYVGGVAGEAISGPCRDAHTRTPQAASECDTPSYLAPAGPTTRGKE
jgi:hypothetical protein